MLQGRIFRMLVESARGHIIGEQVIARSGVRLRLVQLIRDDPACTPRRPLPAVTQQSLSQPTFDDYRELQVLAA
jgi:hypothetical protein